jgi:hypothetical protein
MPGVELLVANLLSPLVLAFALGVFGGLIKSELELPDAVLKLLATYLLLSIGLKGGVQLARTDLAALGPLLLATVALTVLIPVIVFYALRSFGRFDAANAAAVAAHYGSVSSVTFFTAVAFAKEMQTPSEGYLAAVVAIMEWGVVVALVLARWSLGSTSERSWRQPIVDTLRGRGVLLLSGGMLIGFVSGDTGWQQVAPFYDTLFRGVLMLFLLEMGLTAARQLSAFATVGRFLSVFAVVAPLLFGTGGVLAGHGVGLGVGGAFVFGAICASASYIDAPAACRASLPQANPGIYITASLAITFPFNMLIGLPIYYQLATWLAAA